MLKDYLSLSRDEFIDLIFFSCVFGLMFSLSSLWFSTDANFVITFLVFSVFIFLLMSSRLVFMKYVAYRNGFEWIFYLTRFDKYGFRNYDRISYTSKDLKNGIYSIWLVFLLYILTLGLVIYTGVFRFKNKTIPHRFIGTKQKYEGEIYENATKYRECKVYFAGFVYYVIFAFVLKAFFNLINASVYNEFMYITFYVGFVSMIAMFATEGYDYYLRGKAWWYATLTIMVLAMLAILIFNSLTYTLVITFISIIVVLLVMLWRWLM